MIPVHFYVGCPYDGFDLEHVSTQDPKGWPERERRVVMRCVRPSCRKTVVLEVRLLDVHRRQGVPA